MRIASTFLLSTTLMAQAPSPVAAVDYPLTKAEKAQAIEMLAKSREAFVRSLEGLSEAQVHFKAAPEKWSILECAEHIANTETLVGQGVVTKGLQGSPDPSKRAEIGVLDAAPVAMMLDRSRKFTAPDMVAPKGRLMDLKAVLAAFDGGHDLLVAAAEKGDGLRSRVAPHPGFGTIDLYQWILFTAAHTARHTQQILEVKSAAGYPAK